MLTCFRLLLMLNVCVFVIIDVCFSGFLFGCNYQIMNGVNLRVRKETKDVFG